MEELSFFHCTKLAESRALLIEKVKIVRFEIPTQECFRSRRRGLTAARDLQLFLHLPHNYTLSIQITVDHQLQPTWHLQNYFTRRIVPRGQHKIHGQRVAGVKKVAAVVLPADDWNLGLSCDTIVPVAEVNHDMLVPELLLKAVDHQLCAVELAYQL